MVPSLSESIRMNKGTDIEALVRQNENITCRDGAAEKDIMPATQTGDVSATFESPACVLF